MANDSRTVTVIAVGSIRAGGKLHPPGSSITLPRKEADRLLALGAATSGAAVAAEEKK